MNRGEAQRIIGDKLDELRDLSYEELCETYLDETVTAEVEGPLSGTLYQLEIEAFWDDGPHGNLRVMVAVDDGGLAAFKPMTGDFIIAPDGSFVGE
jgi:hypothetical protein